MALYTSNYLRNLSSSYTINESITKMFSANENQVFDIFISHSYLDRDEIKGLYIELSNMGYTVYVDWIVDPHLNRNNVTKDTAKLIRKRLKSSKSLLLAVSANASLSKWMPWELGYVDGNTNRCAILPVSQDNVTRIRFDRAEYLLLYPFIDRANNNLGVEKIWVNEDTETYVLFERWINGAEPFAR